MEQELDTLPEGPPSLAVLKGLEYAPMVLSEALRLYPPAWAIARNVINDHVVCDYTSVSNDNSFCGREYGRESACVAWMQRSEIQEEGA